MNKIIKKILFYFLLFTFYCLLPKQILAADFTVTCPQEGPVCTMSPSGSALFSETNWAPGDSVTRTITFINQDIRYDCPLTLEVYNPIQTPHDFATKLLTEIKDRFGPTWYGGSGETLDNLYNGGIISLGDIPANGTKYFDWTVTFDTQAGNEYQSAETVFDFDLYFECGRPESSPSPSSPPGSSPSPGPGTSPSPSPGTGGAPPLWSMGFFDTGIGGFFGDILGITEPAEEEPEDTGVRGVSEETGPKVKGETTCEWYYYLWYLPLVLQGILTFIYYSWLKNRDIKNTNVKIPAWWSMPVILAALSQIIHEILGCECAASKWCPWYWLFNLIIFSALTFYYWKRKKKQSSDLTEE